MKEIKRKIRRFRREYNIRTCTLPALTQAFEKQGFTIIWFNPVLNDKDVETVVHEKQGFTIIWFNPVLNDKDVETVVHALGLEE